MTTRLPFTQAGIRKMIKAAKAEGYRVTMGFPLRVATPSQWQRAVMFGKLISREGGIVAYQYAGAMYVLSDHELRAAEQANATHLEGE